MTLEPVWCQSCHELRQKLEMTQKEYVFNFSMLKKKIISTDALIKKFIAQKQKCEAQALKLEQIGRLMNQLHAELRTRDTQLAKAMQEVVPLTSIKEVLEATQKAQANKIQLLEDKLLAAEQLHRQLQVALKEKEEKEQQQSTMTKQQESEISKLKSNEDQLEILTEAKVEAEKRVSASLKLAVYFGQCLERRGIIPWKASTKVSHFLRSGVFDDDNGRIPSSGSLDAKLLKTLSKFGAAVETVPLEDSGDDRKNGQLSENSNDGNSRTDFDSIEALFDSPDVDRSHIIEPKKASRERRSISPNLYKGFKNKESLITKPTASEEEIPDKSESLKEEKQNGEQPKENSENQQEEPSVVQNKENEEVLSVGEMSDDDEGDEATADDDLAGRHLEQLLLKGSEKPSVAKNFKNKRPRLRKKKWQLLKEKETKSQNKKLVEKEDTEDATVTPRTICPASSTQGIKETIKENVVFQLPLPVRSPVTRKTPKRLNARSVNNEDFCPKKHQGGGDYLESIFHETRSRDLLSPLPPSPRHSEESSDSEFEDDVVYEDKVSPGDESDMLNGQDSYGIESCSEVDLGPTRANQIKADECGNSTEDASVLVNGKQTDILANEKKITEKDESRTLGFRSHNGFIYSEMEPGSGPENLMTKNSEKFTKVASLSATPAIVADDIIDESNVDSQFSSHEATNGIAPLSRAELEAKSTTKIVTDVYDESLETASSPVDTNVTDTGINLFKGTDGPPLSAAAESREESMLSFNPEETLNLGKAHANTSNSVPLADDLIEVPSTALEGSDSCVSPKRLQNVSSLPNTPKFSSGSSDILHDLVTKLAVSNDKQSPSAKSSNLMKYSFFITEKSEHTYSTPDQASSTPNQACSTPDQASSEICGFADDEGVRSVVEELVDTINRKETLSSEMQQQIAAKADVLSDGAETATTSTPVLSECDDMTELLSSPKTLNKSINTYEVKSPPISSSLDDGVETNSVQCDFSSELEKLDLVRDVESEDYFSLPTSPSIDSVLQSKCANIGEKFKYRTMQDFDDMMNPPSIGSLSESSFEHLASESCSEAGTINATENLVNGNDSTIFAQQRPEDLNESPIKIRMDSSDSSLSPERQSDVVRQSNDLCDVNILSTGRHQDRMGDNKIPAESVTRDKHFIELPVNRLDETKVEDKGPSSNQCFSPNQTFRQTELHRTKQSPTTVTRSAALQRKYMKIKSQYARNFVSNGIVTSFSNGYSERSKNTPNCDGSAELHRLENEKPKQNGTDLNKKGSRCLPSEQLPLARRRVVKYKSVAVIETDTESEGENFNASESRIPQRKSFFKIGIPSEDEFSSDADTGSAAIVKGHSNGMNGNSEISTAYNLCDQHHFMDKHNLTSGSSDEAEAMNNKNATSPTNSKKMLPPIHQNVCNMEVDKIIQKKSMLKCAMQNLRKKFSNSEMNKTTMTDSSVRPQTDVKFKQKTNTGVNSEADISVVTVSTDHNIVIDEQCSDADCANESIKEFGIASDSPGHQKLNINSAMMSEGREVADGQHSNASILPHVGMQKDMEEEDSQKLVEVNAPISTIDLISSKETYQGTCRLKLSKQILTKKNTEDEPAMNINSTFEKEVGSQFISGKQECFKKVGRNPRLCAHETNAAGIDARDAKDELVLNKQNLTSADKSDHQVYLEAALIFPEREASEAETESTEILDTETDVGSPQETSESGDLECIKSCACISDTEYKVIARSDHTDGCVHWKKPQNLETCGVSKEVETDTDRESQIHIKAAQAFLDKEDTDDKESDNIDSLKMVETDESKEDTLKATDSEDLKSRVSPSDLSVEALKGAHGQCVSHIISSQIQPMSKKPESDACDESRVVVIVARTFVEKEDIDIKSDSVGKLKVLEDEIDSRKDMLKVPGCDYVKSSTCPSEVGKKTILVRNYQNRPPEELQTDSDIESQTFRKAELELFGEEDSNIDSDNLDKLRIVETDMDSEKDWCNVIRPEYTTSPSKTMESMGKKVGDTSNSNRIGTHKIESAQVQSSGVSTQHHCVRHGTVDSPCCVDIDSLSDADEDSSNDCLRTQNSSAEKLLNELCTGSEMLNVIDGNTFKVKRKSLKVGVRETANMVYHNLEKSVETDIEQRKTSQFVETKKHNVSAITSVPSKPPMLLTPGKLPVEAIFVQQKIIKTPSKSALKNTVFKQQEQAHKLAIPDSALNTFITPKCTRRNEGEYEARKLFTPVKSPLSPIGDTPVVKLCKSGSLPDAELAVSSNFSPELPKKPCKTRTNLFVESVLAQKRKKKVAAPILCSNAVDSVGGKSSLALASDIGPLVNTTSRTESSKRVPSISSTTLTECDNLHLPNGAEKGPCSTTLEKVKNTNYSVQDSGVVVSSKTVRTVTDLPDTELAVDVDCYSQWPKTKIRTAFKRPASNVKSIPPKRHCEVERSDLSTDVQAINVDEPVISGKSQCCKTDITTESANSVFKNVGFKPRISHFRKDEKVARTGEEKQVFNTNSSQGKRQKTSAACKSIAIEAGSEVAVESSETTFEKPAGDAYCDKVGKQNLRQVDISQTRLPSTMKTRKRELLNSSCDASFWTPANSKKSTEECTVNGDGEKRKECTMGKDHQSLRDTVAPSLTSSKSTKKAFQAPLLRKDIAAPSTSMSKSESIVQKLFFCSSVPMCDPSVPFHYRLLVTQHIVKFCGFSSYLLCSFERHRDDQLNLTKSATKFLFDIKRIPDDCIRASVIKYFQQSVLFHIFGGHEILLTGKGMLVRVYTALCKWDKDIEKPRVLCYDILYSGGSSAPSVIANILDVWPEVLMYNGSSPLNEAIQFLLCRDVPNLSAESNLKRFLESTCQLTSQHQTAEDFVSSLLNKLKSISSNSGDADVYSQETEIIQSLVLICKIHEWEWTNDVVIIKLMWPILQKWSQSESTYDNSFIASCLKLIGYLGRSCPINKNTPILGVMKCMEKLLSEEFRYKIDASVAEAAAETLVVLKPYDPVLCSTVLSSWSSMAERISPKLLSLIYATQPHQ